MAVFELFVIAGCASLHLTHEYKDDYNERNDCAGARIEYSNGANSYGLGGFVFSDSFKEQSESAGFTYTREIFKRGSVLGDNGSLAVGAYLGGVSTSYYSGAVVAPILEADYRRLRASVSYMPKVDGAEELLMFQTSFKVLEW